MKRVLVTGAAGFIGRHCLPLLVSRGYDVHAISSRLIAEKGEGIQWHQVNLLDPPKTAALMADVRPSHLLHFAWYAVPGKYWTSTDNLRWVQASLGLLHAFAQNGGQRVVMAGSCAEYDWQYGHCSELITPLAPSTLYGVCKRSLQLILDAFARQIGVSAAWGRIFFLYGPYEKPDKLVSSVIRSMLQGKSAHCTHGNQIRDFLYVLDVADAFVALLESNVFGAVNIASGHPIALKVIIDKIAEKLNQRHLIHLGAIPALADEPHLLVADIRRLHNEVGWRPKFDLDMGLTETIAWWKRHSF